MGRPLRHVPGGVVFHVLNRRVLRLPIFERDADYVAFERVLIQAMRRADAPELFAYCLMPNHWHMLVRPRANDELSRWMHWLTMTHAQRWHAFRETAGLGPLYQGRFRCFPVEDDDHFLTVARYVERNALRAGLVPPPGGADAWRWCSLAVREHGPAALRAILSAWPMERRPDWVRWVTEPQSSGELDAIRRSVVRGSPYGGESWSTQVAETLKLRQTLNPCRRPKSNSGGYQTNSARTR